MVDPVCVSTGTVRAPVPNDRRYTRRQAENFHGDGGGWLSTQLKSAKFCATAVVGIHFLSVSIFFPALHSEAAGVIPISGEVHFSGANFSAEAAGNID